MNIRLHILFISKCSIYCKLPNINQGFKNFLMGSLLGGGLINGWAYLYSARLLLLNQTIVNLFNNNYTVMHLSM